jgi:hypothetical protein
MRHAGGHAAGAVKIVALTAARLIGNAVLQNLLVLRGERGFLSASPRLGLIELLPITTKAPAIPIAQLNFR